MDPLHPCPPLDARPAVGQAYLFVHEPVSDPANFTPAAISNPPRMLKAKERGDIHAACLHCALSMFDNISGIMEKHKKLTEVLPAVAGLSPRAMKKRSFNLGTHIAVGNIDQTGMMSEVEYSRHFSLWPYDPVTLAQKFAILGKLP